MQYEIESRIKHHPTTLPLKFKLSHKTINANSYRGDKDMRSLVSTFRQNVFNPKLNKNKFKTSKNSPERAFNEKHHQNAQSGINHNVLNSKIVLRRSTNNDIEKTNYENLLKRKIIKIQQKNKKAITTLSTHNNSNNSIMINHTNYNYLPSAATSNKFLLSGNNQNIITSFQKRSNSALDDDYYKNHIKSNSHVYSKYVSSSSSASKKKNTMKSPFTNINNNNYMFNHLKNSSLFSATINTKAFPKVKCDLKAKSISKTTFPTKENSRRESTEKETKNIKKGHYSNTSNSSIGNVIYTNNTIKHDIKKYSPPQEIKSDIECIKFNNVKKDIQQYEDSVYSNIILSSNQCNHSKKESINVKKKEKKISDIAATPQKKKKTKSSSPDRDIENDMNNNDSLLAYINSNIDNNQCDTSMMNSSFESAYSTQNDTKYNYIHKDMEMIISYIKQFYAKYHQYPSTKIKFYKYGRLLGKGAFGKVNLSLHLLTGRLVAIKSINKSKLISERQKSKIAIETSIMKSLFNSNHIVKMYETFETQKHICIVMEYICAGDLLTFIRKRSKLPEQTAKYIFKQIILGLNFIHTHNIVHRDIKLDNILIDLDNNIKICDFGVSKRITIADTMNEQCGTPAYMAPEVIKGNGYQGFACDLWSAGVVLYAMLSGTVPFKGSDLKESHNLIMKGVYKEIEDISREAKHLIRCLLEVDPRKRITTEKALYHPWLVNVDVNVRMNLFTNAERILLAKSNVDYRDCNNKENMVENFNIKNIDTGEDLENKNNNTKSIILAPFNSSVSENLSRSSRRANSSIDCEKKELIIKNNVIKFNVKARDLNRNYELNNNGEIDNGIVISPNDSVNEPAPGADDLSDRIISPFVEEREVPIISSSEVNGELKEDIIKKMMIMGYSASYIKSCIRNGEFNYATACYYLLVKYS